jgi:ABC-type cobalamin transport system ATPase subunit
MKKILLVATTLALACGLMLGTGSVLAADEGQNQSQIQNEYCRGLFGTVDEIVLNSDNVPVTIKLTNVKPADSTADGTADVAVTENTTFHIPSVTTALTGGAWQKWDQLTEESQDVVMDANRVAILLTEPATDQIAQKVMIIPAKKLYQHRYQHRLGVVVDVEGDTATVAQKNGEQITVQLGEGAEVEAGQFVIMVTDRQTNQTQLRAVHSYRLERMIERFEGYMEGSLNQKDFDEATAMLQAAHEKHIAVMEQIQTRLEEQNRTKAANAVGTAMQYCEARHAEALQLRSQIRERIQQAGGWDEWRSEWAEISGNVTSVDLVSRTVVIDTADGAVTLQVPLRTRIVKDGNLFSLKSLEAGDVVTEAVYHIGNVNIAIYIEIA